MISTNYPWKDYIIATSDGGMLETNYGTNKTIPAGETTDNKELNVTSDKGYIVKYNRNGKIEKILQIKGFDYGWMHTKIMMEILLFWLQVNK